MRITEEVSDTVVLTEIGIRIASLRLERNLTQAQLADRAGVSKSTVERIEDGNTAQFSSFIRVVRALGLLSQFESFLPEQVASPMTQLKLKSNQRRRASSKRGRDSAKPWSWGDAE